MSAGEQLDLAHKCAAKAAGLLSLTIEKRRIKRDDLERALQLLEGSVATIKGVLTANGGGRSMGASTPESQEN